MRRKMPIFYSALLLTGVNLILRLVATSFQVHISNRIGAEGVGLLQLVMSVGSLAMTAGMAGVRTTTMYLTAEVLGKKKQGAVAHVLSACVLYSVICSSCVAIMLYLLAPHLAQSWIGNVQVVNAIRLFALFLPIVCLTGCMSGYFTAANRIGTLAAVEILEQVCYMVFTMTLLHYKAGTDPAKACQAVVLGSGISSLVTLSALTVLRLLQRDKAGPPVPMGKRLTAIALPLALGDDLKAGINTLENLMVPKQLARYRGIASPLAAFGLVCGMVFPVMMFPAAILFGLTELLIPELARCHAALSKKRIRYLTYRSLKVALLYGCFCGGLMVVLSQPLCMALYNNADAGIALQQYALLVPMLYCDAITDAMNKGLGQQKISVRFNIVTSAMDVALLFVLLPRLGMQGYFLSFLVTHLINFLLSLRLLIRCARVKIAWQMPVVALTATTIAIAAANAFSQIPLQIAAFLAVWGSLLVLGKAISKEDAAWLVGLVYKK